MDPWINSLVQSPLVRSLNTVPSRMSSFAFGVRDNVPPFSFAKEVVNSVSGDAWDTTSLQPTMAGAKDMDFRIPQSGLLDRVYLRVRMYNKYTARAEDVVSKLPFDQAIVAGSGVDTVQRRTLNKRYRDARSSSVNFANIISQIDLKTAANKPVETLYPAAIAAAVQKLPPAQRLFWMQSLNGFAAGFQTSAGSTLVSPFTYLWNPFYECCTEVGTTLVAVGASSAYENHLFADFLIPLPFSLMHQLKDNLQTRFVDDLTISVKFKQDAQLAVVQGSSTLGNFGFKSSLVCIYHNFHDVIENSIRDQNFKRGFPASIYSHNYKLETGSAISGKLLRVNLTNKNLVSEILCLFRYSSSTTVPLYSLPPDDGSVGPFLFTLYGSGRQIWQAYSWELTGPDTADYQLAEAHAYGEDLSHPERELVVSSGVVPPLDDNSVATAAILDRITLGFPHLYALRFGFQSNDNFYTGGLALQTLSSPYLTIENLGTGDIFTHATSPGTFDVVVKTCQMIRIDSDTGVITTSLDV